VAFQWASSHRHFTCQVTSLGHDDDDYDDNNDDDDDDDDDGDDEDGDDDDGVGW
jgi:hypothetical protein